MPLICLLLCMHHHNFDYYRVAHIQNPLVVESILGGRRQQQKIQKWQLSLNIPTSIQQDIEDEIFDSIQHLSIDEAYCDNCLRQQSIYLIENFGDIYRLELTER